MRITRFLAVILASTLQLSAAQTLVELTFPTLTELGAYTVSTYQTNLTANVLGNAAIADGGASTWFFAPNSVAVVDGTTVIASTGVAGRWLIAPGAGTGGDVVGPFVAVDGNLATFDGITGKLIQDGGVAIADIENFATVDTIAALDAYPGTATTVIVADPVRGGTFRYSATAPSLSDAVRYVDGFTVSSGVATINTVIPHGYANGESVTLSGASISDSDGTTDATATSGSTKTITAIAVTVANSATITVASHGWTTGTSVTIADVPAPWDILDGTYSITVGADPNSFTISGTWPVVNTSHTITVVDADTFTIPLALNDGDVDGQTILATGAWRKIDGIAHVRAAGGYWVREYDGPINPVWLGLTSNSAATLPIAETNTYAMNRALALRRPSYYIYKTEVLVPAGHYCFSDTIHVNEGASLIGTGRDTTAFYRHSSTNGTTPMVKVSSAIQGAKVSGLTLSPVSFTGDVDGVLLSYLRGSGCQRVVISDMNINNCDAGVHLHAGSATSYGNFAATRGIYFCDITDVFCYGCTDGILTDSESGGSINGNWFNSVYTQSSTRNGIRNEAGANFFDGISIEYCHGNPIYDSANLSSYERFWIEDNYSQSLSFSGGSVYWGHGVMAESTTLDVADDTRFISLTGFNGTEGANIVDQYPNDGIQYPRGLFGGDVGITLDGTRYAFGGGRTTPATGSYGTGLTFTTNVAGSTALQFITWPYIGTATSLRASWSVVIGHVTTSIPASGAHKLFGMGPATGSDYLAIKEISGVNPAYEIQVSQSTNHVLNSTWVASGNVVTVTTATPHAFVIGDSVMVRGGPITSALRTITGTPASNQFTYDLTVADGSGSFAANQYSYIIKSILYAGDIPYTRRQDSGLSWIGCAWDSTTKILRITSGRKTVEYYADWTNADKTYLSTRNFGFSGTLSTTYTVTVPFYGFWNRALTAGEISCVMNQQQFRQKETKDVVPNLVFDAGYTPALSGASQVGLYSALDGSSKAQLYTKNSDSEITKLSGAPLVTWYTNAGTYTFTPQSWTKSITVTCIGGGGGGGSGRVSANGVAAYGGGGGGGGGFNTRTFSLAELTPTPATFTVVVGAGGNGGAAQTNASTDGITGVDGNLSSFGVIIRAYPGSNGTAGTQTIGSGGSNNAPGGGSSISATSGSGTTVGRTTYFNTAAGAGGGGGIDTGDTHRAGGLGGYSYYVTTTLNGGSSGAAGGTAGGNGDSCSVLTQGAWPAAGGGGGGGNTGGAGGAGGAGGWPGGGGGGGGAARNGSASGAGGAGAGGLVLVVEHP